MDSNTQANHSEVASSSPSQLLKANKVIPMFSDLTAKETELKPLNTSKSSDISLVTVPADDSLLSPKQSPSQV